jgi:CDGSH-type Zn-finger protein
VQVIANGPLDAHGNLAIAQNQIDSDGIKHRASLCRCGASHNKPFCDGSHKQQQFNDAGQVKGNPQTLDHPLAGELSIKPAPDGPLLVKGKFCIKDSAGNTQWQGERIALCRCGASHNKPFCDGSHGVMGFRAET